MFMDFMELMSVGLLHSVSGVFAKRVGLAKVARSFIETERCRRLWQTRTLENYGVLLGHYERYKGDVRIDRVDARWMDGFVEYLYSVAGLRNSTIQMLLQQHRAVMRWAKSEGYRVRDEALQYSAKLRSANCRSNVVALTREELRRLLDQEIGSSALEAVRDVFCFCCLTSLRYSDIKRLKWSNINDGWVEMTSQKTNEFLRIPLNTNAYNIIKRYAGRDMVLPVVSCVNYNRGLKKVARMAGLDRMVTHTWYVGPERHEEVRPLYEVISSHVGRKTFVTLALSVGMPVEVLCSFTGHRDSRQLKHYCDISREEQRRWGVTLGLQA